MSGEENYLQSAEISSGPQLNSKQNVKVQMYYTRILPYAPVTSVRLNLTQSALVA